MASVLQRLPGRQGSRDDNNQSCATQYRNKERMPGLQHMVRFVPHATECIMELDYINIGLNAGCTAMLFFIIMRLLDRR